MSAEIAATSGGNGVAESGVEVADGVDTVSLEVSHDGGNPGVVIHEERTERTFSGFSFERSGELRAKSNTNNLDTVVLESVVDGASVGLKFSSTTDFSSSDDDDSLGTSSRRVGEH